MPAAPDVVRISWLTGALANSDIYAQYWYTKNLHRVQKKSNIFIFTIYFSQFVDKFYETFSEYP